MPIGAPIECFTFGEPLSGLIIDLKIGHLIFELEGEEKGEKNESNQDQNSGRPADGHAEPRLADLPRFVNRAAFIH